MSTRVYLDSQEITANTTATDWPEYLETSVKGPGFFEWEVKPFRFRAIDTEAAIGDLVRVTIGGTQRLLGTVSSIEDKYTDEPLIEAMPFGAALKDVKAGQETADDAGRLRWEFKLDTDTPIQTALQTLLARFNANKPVHIAGTAWTVSVPGSTDDILGVFAPYGLTRFNGLNGHGGSSPAQFTNGGLPVPSYSISAQLRDDGSSLLIGVYVRGEEISGTPVTQVKYYRLPYAGPPAGNVLYSATYASPEAWGGWDLLNGTTATDVSTGQIITYAQRVTGFSDLEFLAAVQFAGGVWGLVKRRDEDLRTWVYAVWWGDPRQQTVRGRWYNKSMADLVKLFTLVSGRWLKIEGSAITLPLRDSDLGSVTLPADSLALSYDQQDTQQTPPSIGVQVQPPVTDSDPDPEGLGGWTESRTVALSWWYNDRFAGVCRTTEAEFIASELPAGADLLAHAVGIGHIIGKDYSTDGHTVKPKMIQEAAE